MQLCGKFLGKILVLKSPGVFTLIPVWLQPQQVSANIPLTWIPCLLIHIGSEEMDDTDLA